jgi:hypothetical protein
MRFDEPDVREAYKQGARDSVEKAVGGLKLQHARELKGWLNKLDSWQDGDPPPAPLLG